MSVDSATHELEYDYSDLEQDLPDHLRTLVRIQGKMRYPGFRLVSFLVEFPEVEGDPVVTVRAAIQGDSIPEPQKVLTGLSDAYLTSERDYPEWECVAKTDPAVQAETWTFQGRAKGPGTGPDICLVFEGLLAEELARAEMADKLEMGVEWDWWELVCDGVVQEMGPPAGDVIPGTDGASDVNLDGSAIRATALKMEGELAPWMADTVTSQGRLVKSDPPSKHFMVGKVQAIVETALKKIYGRTVLPEGWAKQLREAIKLPEETRRGDEQEISGAAAVIFTEYPGLSQYDNKEFWAELRTLLEAEGLHWELVDGGTATIRPKV